MAKPSIDLSLYLVTGRELLPPNKDYYESLEEALQGGVTVVQVREKTADTGEFLDIASKTSSICAKYGVPLIINDRVDIALAVNAAGVHIGQSDMPVSVTRRLLPSDCIIGKSVSDVEEAKVALEEGVDYVGIGAIWATTSKKLVRPVVGVRGVGEILEVFLGSDIKTVGIGGLKSTTVLRTLHGATTPCGTRTLDGVAVVSDIVASPNPRGSAELLSKLIRAFYSRPSPNFAFPFSAAHQSYTEDDIKSRAAGLLKTLKAIKPLVHQITNTVVATQSANITLALGASPIMATAPQEMEDLSKIPGALLVNIGTIANKDGMLVAGRHANLNRKPIVFDPVGVGATSFRRAAADELLNSWQATVIKGNAAEIGTLAKTAEVQSKGVDSVGSGFSDPVAIVKALARKERCVVVMTGPQDYISDGHTTIRLSNGDPMLADITGSGCIVGTVVASFCGISSISAQKRLSAQRAAGQTDTDHKAGLLVDGNMLIASVAGVLAITVASELAVERPEVRGTGTFLPALIDAIYGLTPEDVASRAKVEIIR
ncbi:hypothetical protein BOTBODRAFT_25958 [Botryobasidium botryosum FD-172 SS1]|uniref:Thiamine phosphate synthase/TenI domain-containing protein n=1 Tax=Botryobasidium botryosum (strain FD-172 SS1) TaxID=930990 RepID=A0A067NBL1_BOTB1|nr:hypothetical protein BOTBODRAFT_25958 [Botryobasidium botryosum FD-172 SS1]